MVDKDDLFPEKNGANPQDQDREETSSGEDDDIIELFDMVEIPGEDIEEEIIELEDMVEVSDDGMIDLTEEIQTSVGEDDILDLTDVVTDESELEDDVLELTDIAAADDEEGDGALDLTKKAESPDIDDDIIDLTEPATEDEVFELLDTVEVPFKEMVKDSVETADFPWKPDPDTGDDSTDPTENVAEDEVVDLLDTIEIPAQDMGKDNVETLDTTLEADLDTGDDIFDSAEDITDFDIDEAAIDLTETVEDIKPDQEDSFQETTALSSAGYEEDKELLELIDDIQATLNDEPVAEPASDQDGTPQAGEPIVADALDKDADAYTFLDSDEVVEDGELPETETEFADHLGIDLSSEIEKEAPEKSQEAVSEDVKPIEDIELGIAPGTLETAVKQALNEMLAEENNPLTKAIEHAVKKALSQGADT